MEAFIHVQNWCALNNIRVNIKKTKHMIIGGNRKECLRSKEWELQGIMTVENFIYLGVTIDRKLNFEKFVSATITKAKGRLITLSRLRRLLDLKTCLLIYKQTILPILDYLSFLVYSSTQRKISKLQPVQNRAIRIVRKKSGYISTADMEVLHKELKLKLLVERRKLFMLALMYKLSKIENNVNTYRPEMLLRTSSKVKMKLALTKKKGYYTALITVVIDYGISWIIMFKMLKPC